MITPSKGAADLVDLQSNGQHRKTLLKPNREIETKDAISRVAIRGFYPSYPTFFNPLFSPIARNDETSYYFAKIISKDSGPRCCLIY